MSLVTGLLPFTSEMALFEFPFNELLVSNVLNLNDLDSFPFKHIPNDPFDE